MFFKKTIKMFLCLNFCSLQTSDNWRVKVVSSCAAEQRTIFVRGKTENIYLQQFIIADGFTEKDFSDLKRSLLAEPCLCRKYAVLFRDKESNGSLMQNRVAYEQHYEDEILRKSIVVGFGVNLENQNQEIALAIKQAIFNDIQESLGRILMSSLKNEERDEF